MELQCTKVLNRTCSQHDLPAPITVHTYARACDERVQPAFTQRPTHGCNGQLHAKPQTRSPPAPAAAPPHSESIHLPTKPTHPNPHPHPPACQPAPWEQTTAAPGSSQSAALQHVCRSAPQSPPPCHPRAWAPGQEGAPRAAGAAAAPPQQQQQPLATKAPAPTAAAHATGLRRARQPAGPQAAPARTRRRRTRPVHAAAAHAAARAAHVEACAGHAVDV